MEAIFSFLRAVLLGCQQGDVPVASASLGHSELHHVPSDQSCFSVGTRAPCPAEWAHPAESLAICEADGDFSPKLVELVRTEASLFSL